VLARCGGGVHGGAACGRSGKRKTLHATVVALLQTQRESGARVAVRRHGCGESGGCGQCAFGQCLGCEACIGVCMV
jgi:hypothetical protein